MIRAISAKSSFVAPYLLDHEVSILSNAIFFLLVGDKSSLLLVFNASIAEHLGGAGGIGDATGLGHHRTEQTGRVGAIVVHGLQATGVHLLEAHDEHTVGGTVGDHGACHGQASRTGGAVVVDVVDGDLGKTELVEDALAASTVAVDVASDTLVDVVVGDLGIEHGLDASLVAQLIVVDLAARFDELGHSHA